MPTYSQIPLRLRLSLVSNPPVAPIDDNTGLQPSFFRAEDIAMAIGIFDQFDVAVDLSNLVQLEVILQPAQNSPQISAMVVIPAGSIIPTIDVNGWQIGTEQQAVAQFTAAQTDVGLSAQPQQDYWLIIQGVTNTGTVITYGAGAVTIVDSGTQTPPANSNVTGHNQAVTGSNATITPLSQMHTEKLTVGGSSPRTVTVVAGVFGIQQGARLNIELPTPTSGVTLNFYSGINTGPLIKSFTTASRTDHLEFYFDGTQWQDTNIPTA